MNLMLVIFFGMCSIFNLDHDIHVSTCDVKYNTKTSSIQISVRIYLDDFEASLAMDGYKELKTLTKKESPIADSLVEDYISKHLILQLDGQKRSMEYLGKEISEDFLAMWCYLEIYDVETLKVLKVQNDILMELYDDQQNIASIKLDHQRKGHFIFSKNKISESLQM